MLPYACRYARGVNCGTETVRCTRGCDLVHRRRLEPMRMHGDMTWGSNGPSTGGRGDRSQQQASFGVCGVPRGGSSGKVLLSAHLQGQDAEAGEGGQAARR